MSDSAVELGKGPPPAAELVAGVEPGEPGSDGKPPSLRMLADRPLAGPAEDRLDFADYARALAELIDHPGTHTPLTIALSAPWGAGKTSLARLVDGLLSAWRREWGQPPHVVCWFNAWAHDDAAHLGAAFAADVAKTVNRERPWWWRLVAPLPAAMLSPRERWRRRIALALGALVVALAISVLPGVRELYAESGSGVDFDAALGARLGSVALFLSAVYVLWRSVFASTERAARFIDDPRSEAARGSMRDVSEELGRLIGQATGGRRKLVVFVDDLERCRPPRALQVCETASNLLAHPNVVTVLIADMRVIASSAALKYARLESPEGDPRRSGEYGRLYLQKIVQIQFDLPPTTEERVRQILTEEAEAEPAREGLPPLPRAPGHARLRMILERVMIVGTLVIVVGSAVYFAVYPPESADDRGTAAFTGAFGAAIGLFLTATIVRFVADVAVLLYRRGRSWRSRRRLTKIDVSITKLATKGKPTPESVASAVKEKHKIKEGSAEERLVNDRVARYFTHESHLKDEAEAPIVQFLPLIPRSAKRMMNHLRLRLYVAIRRGLLGSELEPRHLGKWVVLEERWPELAHEVIREPAKLQELETVRNLRGLGETLERLELGVEPSEDLVEFLSASPRLGPVAERLIYLEPAPAPTASG